MLPELLLPKWLVVRSGCGGRSGLMRFRPAKAGNFSRQASPGSGDKNCRLASLLLATASLGLSGERASSRFLTAGSFNRAVQEINSDIQPHARFRPASPASVAIGRHVCFDKQRGCFCDVAAGTGGLPKVQSLPTCLAPWRQ